MSGDHERQAVPGGWVVSRATNQADEGGVRWVQLSLYREPEPDSGSWSRAPSTRAARRPSSSGARPRA